MVKADNASREQTNVSLPAPLLKKLRLVAKRERRTQSGIIEAALIDYFRRQDGEPLTPEQQAAIEAYLEERFQLNK